VEEAVQEQAQGQTSIKQESETSEMKIEGQTISMPGIPLDELLGAIAKQGEQYIADGNEHAAQLFLLRKAGAGYAVEVIAVAPMPGDQQGKDAVAEAIGHLVAPFDAYIFLTEAYYVQVKSREEVEQHIGKVKDTPGRVEVFQLHFVSKAGESRMMDWEILRAKGEKPKFGPRKDRTSDLTEGRFVNFYLWQRDPREAGN
jgi:hypothetical protein